MFSAQARTARRVPVPALPLNHPSTRKNTMSRFWWSRFVKTRILETAKRLLPRKQGEPGRRLTVEALEDRTLLSVSIVPGSGNAVGILGTVGDHVWLQTNGSQLRYSTDGNDAHYSDLGVNVTQDVTIT